MKSIIASVVLMMSVAASASSGDLIFVEGHQKGQVADSTSFVGIYNVCYVGNPYAVQTKMRRWLVEDIEKNNTFIKVDKKNKQIIFGYVATKCLDDSLDATPEGCRQWVNIPPCKG
ncbi:hypothetical protein AZI86_02185 [Bdellovibrio bacteriovorus]|uniref:Uncharacterized protein n=1 Tax=Bdellovibrio bacteriovorus TaxID=959 RepID=A0A150WNZ3_BDEBC|nr:hypothetical protein [Bdellovibrio bacteriovorus]KYG65905.1 hypothetical protein AZI86_02185 [Bdellovibrio bacteriovorus]